MNLLSLEYINTLRKSGTIIPSSKYLINKCLEDLDLNSAKVIVEFGMGNGCITKEILKRSGNEAILISFEINKKFCSYCKNKFDGFSSLKIINESAFNFQSVLVENSITKVDCVISSLPISLFNEKDTLNLFNNVKKHLKKGGHFIQYQYTLDSEKLIKKTFNKVNRKFTFLNMPPAFIYKCA